MRRKTKKKHDNETRTIKGEIGIKQKDREEKFEDEWIIPVYCNDYQTLLHKVPLLNTKTINST